MAADLKSSDDAVDRAIQLLPDWLPDAVVAEIPLHVPRCACSPNVHGLGLVLEHTRSWAIAQHGSMAATAVLAKLREEIDEFLKDPVDAGEIADLAIMLYAYANVIGVNLTAAVVVKHRINRNRSWGTPSETGVHHKEDRDGR